MQEDFNTQVLNGLVGMDQVMVDMEVVDNGEGSDSDDDDDVPLVPAYFKASDFPKREQERVNIAVGLNRLKDFSPPLEGRCRYISSTVPQLAPQLH